MKALLTIMAVLWAAAAPAQEFPALYSVHGVASDDVLNVRAGPGAHFEVIGALPPGAAGIEVSAANDTGRWLRVNTGERAGWASAAFLQRTGPDWTQGLPRPLACFGTEPFWSLERTATGALLSEPGIGTTALAERWTGPAQGRTPVEFAALMEGGGGRLTAFVARESCNDGMSDLEYGLSVSLVDDRPGGPRLLSGCCSLAP